MAGRGDDDEPAPRHRTDVRAANTDVSAAHCGAKTSFELSPQRRHRSGGIIDRNDHSAANTCSRHGRGGNDLHALRSIASAARREHTERMRTQIKPDKKVARHDKY